jgi:hypothetical protein
MREVETCGKVVVDVQVVEAKVDKVLVEDEETKIEKIPTS